MGLTRSSSGLLVYDAFDSDTSGDYSTTNGMTMTVTGGYAYCSNWAIHTGSSGTKCVSVSSRYPSGAWLGGPALCANGSGSADKAAQDGYRSHWYMSGVNWRLEKQTNGGATALASSSAISPTANEYHRMRIYRDGDVVRTRYGLSDLANVDSVTDTTYTGTLYGAWANDNGSNSNFRFDGFECRTAHTITCTGLTTGWYLKVSDGTTTAKAAESSGTATVDAGAVLFPLASVGVYDGDPDDGGSLVAELDTGDYADMGGGDAFAYSDSSGLYLPAYQHKIIGLGGPLHG